MSALELGSRRIGIAEVERVSRRGLRVALTAPLKARLAADRAAVERLAAGDTPIYGLNTGLGAAVDTRLAPAEIAEFQARTLRARHVGVGPRLPREQVRAILFARIAGMAAGGSGISPALVDGLLALLNAGVHPVLPAIGSLGAADLARLAPMALPLIGEGEVEYRGKTMRAADALAAIGLAPLALGPKDGLALINSNAGSVGPGALALADAERALAALDAAAALSLEGFRGNPSPLDPRAGVARPAPGQQAAAARLVELLAGSALWQAGAPRRVQDPLSFRCIAPVHGALATAFAAARAALEIELNGAGDNPLLLAAEGAMISTANFDVTALTLAFETLGQALAHAAHLSAERVMKLLAPGFSDLPRFLAPQGPPQTGFATVQKTVAALEAEIRHLALPASLGTLPVADQVEDHAGMAPRVVEKTAEIVARLRWLTAAELLAAAQAIDLRKTTLGPPMQRLHARVRGAVPMLQEDRPLGPDIEAIAALIEQEDLL